MSVGLGTSLRRRETVRLHGSFPTEWPGFHARMPCMGKTLVVDNNVPGSEVVRPRWTRTGRLSVAPVESCDSQMLRSVKPKLFSFQDGRVAVEASNKRPAFLRAWSTHFTCSSTF